MEKISRKASFGRTSVSVLMGLLLAGSSLMALAPTTLGAISIDDVQPPNNSASIGNPYLPMNANISGQETAKVTVDTSTEWLAGTRDPNTIVGGGGTLQLRRTDHDDFSGTGSPDPEMWNYNDNAVQAGGLLTLSTDLGNGIDSPAIRGTTGFNLSQNQGLYLNCSVTPTLMADSGNIFGCGWWNTGPAGDSYAGFYMEDDGSGTGRLCANLLGSDSKYGYSLGAPSCMWNVTVGMTVGVHVQVSTTVVDGITAEFQRGGAPGWNNLGTVKLNLRNITGYQAWSGVDNPVWQGDLSMDVDFMEIGTVLYASGGDYTSAALPTGLFNGSWLTQITFNTTDTQMNGISSVMWQSAPNDTGPWSGFAFAPLNTQISVMASAWIQFQITLTRAAVPSWPDLVSFDLAYKTEVGAYFLDDFPNAPGAINDHSWALTNASTFQEGLDLNSASASSSLGVTYKNDSWLLADTHNVEGVVAVRVLGGSTQAAGGASDPNMLLTGFVSTDGLNPAGSIGVVRATNTSADPVQTYWGISAAGAGSPLLADPCAQLPVVLGAAATYGVLAGSTVTNTGATAVTGDLGVSPGTAVTGFPPGTVSGGTHAGDNAAATAIGDLTTAYNDAAGRTLCPVTVAGNLGGQTLAPGLYKSTSSLAISAGDLTLDAGGDATAVWIFQMASTLTTTSGRQVILAGGAQAANIFWQVGTSATLGTTSVFAGTIMADQAITLDTGATLNGRALARIAAVALDGNAITVPVRTIGGTAKSTFDPVNVVMTDGQALIRFQLQNHVFHAWVLEVDNAWRGWLDLGSVDWGSPGIAWWHIGDIGSHSGTQHAVVDWAALLIKWMTPGFGPAYSAGNLNLNQDENTRAVIAYDGPTWALHRVTYRLDTTPPTGSFTLNGGNAYTKTTSVAIHLQANDTYGVPFYAASESLSFPEGWKPFTGDTSFFLTGGDGRKVVWVRYMDSSGVASAPINQSVILDTQRPSGAVYIANRSAYSNSLDVPVTFLAFDGEGLASAYLANGLDAPNGTEYDLKPASGPFLQSSSQTHSWTLTAGDGTKTVSFVVEDLAGWLSPVYTDDILVDTTPPTLTAVLANSVVRNNINYVNTSRVTVHVEAFDPSGVREVDISEDPAFTTFVQYTQPGNLLYDLPASSGARTLYVRAFDIYSLVAPVVTLNFFVDITPPTGSISIIYTGQSQLEFLSNTPGCCNSETLAKGRGVVLVVNATDNVGVSEVQFSSSLYFPGAAWQPFASGRYYFELSANDGLGKTVYVRFRDVNGNPSQAFVDEIDMDTTPPTGTIIINSGDSSTIDPLLSLSLEGNDNFAGELQMRLSLTPDFNGSTWLPFSDTARFDARTTAGEVTVYYQVRDANGWESLTYSDSITVRTATCQELNNCGPIGSPGFDGAYAAVALAAVAVVGAIGRRRRTL